MHRPALYASIGAELIHFDLDVEAATPTPARQRHPAGQYPIPWPHVSRRFLYAATSDSASGVGGHVGNMHHVSAFAIDPPSGALAPHGEPIPLPTRPIHMTTDIPSRHVLVAFSNPSGMRVYRINKDATLGEEVAAPGAD